jgi:hypothetical protein
VLTSVTKLRARARARPRPSLAVDGGPTAPLPCRLDATRGISTASTTFRTAETLFAEYGLVFHHAATQLEHAEWLVSHGRSDEAGLLLGEARSTFDSSRPDRGDRLTPSGGHLNHRNPA